MKSVIEEYGILIVEFICAIAVIGVLALILSGFGSLAAFLADKILGGV